MKLSFIIPFYNGKKYIGECLDSIYNQNIPKDDFEVIIVNDNSSDVSSVKKLEEFQQLYSNIRVIHNDNNLRCGMCRNIGLRDAKGEYIWFVDQDDYIKPNCLQTLLNQCVSNKLDILYFDYRHVSDDLSYDKKICLIKHDTDVMSGLEFIHNVCNTDFWHNGYDTNVWHAIYKREFMIDKNIYSPPVSYCEDMIVAQKAIILARKFQAMKEDYYNYRYNLESVYNTQVGKNGRLIFDASIYAGSELIKLSKLISEDYIIEKSKLYEGGVFRINSFAKSILKRPLRQKKIFFKYVEYNKEIIKEMQSYFTTTSMWILKHPKICTYLSPLVYIIVKLK